jgi:16S rRNA (guanine527-N7)-methyltransferase
LPLAVRLLADGGTCLFLKGGRVEEELAAAERDWAMTVQRVPSQTSADGVVLRLSGLRPAGLGRG